MDWQTAQNWLVFLPVVGALGWYYMPRSVGSPQDRTQEQGRRASVAPNKKRDEQEGSMKSKSRSVAGRENGHAGASLQDGGEKAKKRKAGMKEQARPAQTTPSVVVHNDEPEEIDMSTKQFAMQMAQARKGAQIGGSKESKDRVKTVKLGSAKDTPDLSSGSSQAGADADDDMSLTASPALHAGDVSDMLEPKTSGPSSLRLTAPTKPQKEKKARQAKEETVLTKKQRQNRKKVEEQREQRLDEEKQRKAMEEQQRRAARISRGEPAKNGIPVSKPPANNAWTAPKQASGDNTTDAPMTNGHNAPLLDTFDAESTGSSNGGMGASTAATSTASGPTHKDREPLSEEDQVAMAMRQSEDESGWTEVAAPKKGKKNGEVAGEVKPVASKASAPIFKTGANGKPNGYQALEDEHQQRADVDPNDASNWDA